MVPFWGTLGRSSDDPWKLGTTRQDTVSTRQDTVRSRLGFYRFLVDLRDPFREIFGYIWTEKHDFFWWFWGLNLGVWDRKIKHLTRKVLQKSTFAEIGFLMFPGSIFHDFGKARDQFSWLLLPWGLVWNLMTFHIHPLGTPRSCDFLALDSKTIEAETWASDPLDTWPSDTMDT